VDAPRVTVKDRQLYIYNVSIGDGYGDTNVETLWGHERLMTQTEMLQLLADTCPALPRNVCWDDTRRAGELMGLAGFVRIDPVAEWCADSIGAKGEMRRALLREIEKLNSRKPR
jgi:hypothetical protein